MIDPSRPFTPETSQAVALAVAAGTIVGAIIGSYLATVAVRWPLGRSASEGRSRCDSCAQPLPPASLVPIVSFLVLKGRCRACRSPIAALHPCMEIAGASVGAASVLLFETDLRLAAATMIMGWQLLLLGVLDVRHFWLPDRLTLLLACSGLAVSALGLGPGLSNSVAGAALGFGSLWAVASLYRKLRGRDGLGGGDAKLFAAIGAWTGAWALPWVLAAAALAGIAQAIVAAACGKPSALSGRVPFGAPLAVAGWFIWIATGLALDRGV